MILHGSEKNPASEPSYLQDYHWQLASSSSNQILPRISYFRFPTYEKLSSFCKAFSIAVSSTYEPKVCIKLSNFHSGKWPCK